MQTPILSRPIGSSEFYFVGIKGTGMSALAELLSSSGATVSGSDTLEQFPTESVLQRAGIPYLEGFSRTNLPERDLVVIYSSVYDPDTHPELVAARDRGLLCVEYNSMLGHVSSLYYSAGICGVHGKTSTTALAGMITKATGVPATVMVPTGVPGFGGGSVFSGGTDFFITETCEYRRHFLDFHPKVILVTNIELEHTDYFKGEDDIADAFYEYTERLPDNGSLIFCADDDGAQLLANRVSVIRPSITLIPYGLKADGDYRITDVVAESGHTNYSVCATRFTLHVPGRHNVLNATGALALVDRMSSLGGGANGPEFYRKAVEGIGAFSGSRRRCELVGAAGGITVVDDYAHHPTELKATIAGLREFYGNRRMIVDFMPHLYSRTADLFEDFAHAFGAADIVFLHEVYASARESGGEVSGKDLFDAVRLEHPAAEYFDKPLDAVDRVMNVLREGDVFVTMGAGDNWQLGKTIAQLLDEKENSK